MGAYVHEHVNQQELAETEEEESMFQIIRICFQGTSVSILNSA